MKKKVTQFVNKIIDNFTVRFPPGVWIFMLRNTNSNVVLHVPLNWCELVTLYRVIVIARIKLITLLKRDWYSYLSKFVDFIFSI